MLAEQITKNPWFIRSMGVLLLYWSQWYHSNFLIVVSFIIVKDRDVVSFIIVKDCDYPTFFGVVLTFMIEHFNKRVRLT